MPSAAAADAVAAAAAAAVAAAPVVAEIAGAGTAVVVASMSAPADLACGDRYAKTAHACTRNSYECIVIVATRSSTLQLRYCSAPGRSRTTMPALHRQSGGAAGGLAPPPLVFLVFDFATDVPPGLGTLRTVSILPSRAIASARNQLANA